MKIEGGGSQHSLILRIVISNCFNFDDPASDVSLNSKGESYHSVSLSWIASAEEDPEAAEVSELAVEAATFIARLLASTHIMNSE